MCSSCVTAADVTAIQVIAGAAFVRAAGRRLHDRLRGRSSLERRLADHEATVAYLCSIGLDGDALVGAPPAVPVTLVAEVEQLNRAEIETVPLQPATT